MTDDTTAPFARMNGLGNRILVVDMRGRHDRVSPQAAIALAGDAETAFDQIMAVHDPRLNGTDQHILILNADGSEAGACGNGTRCVVSALSAETGKNRFTFETAAGILNAEERDNGQIAVDMGTPRFDWQDIPLSEAFQDTRHIELAVGPADDPIVHSPAVVSMGNPHAVFFVDNDVWSYELEKFGPLVENHPLFPERVNVSLAYIRDKQTIDLRTWERGVGLTEACGSAACAAAVSGVRRHRTNRHVTVNLPGGPLDLLWREDDHVIMTGPTEWEWSGRMNPLTGAFTREAETEAENA
ncbi:diaminopimelate epimerase [Notoacmeibacter sp. MSK16QG-6]|uniref:diaminopimelate epimerase n=1 Tax=Notoacmeibacter sp. MSK16QG-6 TaxID=2957982 RepID=UPI0020A0A904|nr:diaminopimelate epimerase [Notoacmeibacter sp. MSK16QG-6]MCP1199179.1 diaminopimelate epimerase [Notoacmeibacter sp. MSK16QG-6]